MEKFSYESNGYNKKEVNQFIREVITETEMIIRRVNQQKIEIERLKEEIEYYKNIDQSINRLLKTKEDENETLKNIAMEEQRIIIEKAKNNASRIINEALLRASQIEQEKRILEKNIESYKRQFKSIIEQQKIIMEEFEYRNNE